MLLKLQSHYCSGQLLHLFPVVRIWETSLAVRRLEEAAVGSVAGPARRLLCRGEPERRHLHRTLQSYMSSPYQV